MLNLVKKARNAVRGETSMEWLKPFMCAVTSTYGGGAAFAKQTVQRTAGALPSSSAAYAERAIRGLNVI
jgi:hypothetical protein